MRDLPGTWGQVEVDSYVRDKHGTAWCIVAEKEGWLRIRNRAGLEDSMLRPPATAPVTLMVPVLEEAVATVAQRLGGTIIYQET